MPLLGTFQDLTQRIRQAGAFVSCLTAQDMADEEAKLLQGRVTQIRAALGNATTLLDHQTQRRCRRRSSRRWRPAPNARPSRTRCGSAACGPPCGWTRSGSRWPATSRWTGITPGGSCTASWSPGCRSPGRRGAEPCTSPPARRRTSSWTPTGRSGCGCGSAGRRPGPSRRTSSAAALNHLAGFRIQLYKHRGWDSILTEPLENNRMKAETLEVMWDVIDRNKGIFVEYLNRKARLLGLDKLAWHDVDAPLGGADTKMTYDEAADFVVEHFGRFSPDMAAFARNAFAGALDRGRGPARQAARRLLHLVPAEPPVPHLHDLWRQPGQRLHPGARAGPRLPPVGDERPAAAGAGLRHERRRDGVHLCRAAGERCRPEGGRQR